jgi:hypothetical protein
MSFTFMTEYGDTRFDIRNQLHIPRPLWIPAYTNSYTPSRGPGFGNGRQAFGSG